MTPKEKAEDLVDSFLRDGYDVVMHTRLAKRCALIAVDELIKENEESIENIVNGALNKQYWMQVKQEIQNL